jgi:hypothetical protein
VDAAVCGRLVEEHPGPQIEASDEMLAARAFDPDVAPHRAGDEMARGAGPGVNAARKDARIRRVARSKARAGRADRPVRQRQQRLVRALEFRVDPLDRQRPLGVPARQRHLPVTAAAELVVEQLEKAPRAPTEVQDAVRPPRVLAPDRDRRRARF